MSEVQDTGRSRQEVLRRMRYPALLAAPTSLSRRIPVHPHLIQKEHLMIIIVSTPLRIVASYTLAFAAGAVLTRRWRNERNI